MVDIDVRKSRKISLLFYEKFLVNMAFDNPLVIIKCMNREGGNILRNANL